MSTCKAGSTSAYKTLVSFSVAAGIIGITTTLVNMNFAPQQSEFLSKPEVRALLLSTFAGLSTTVGAGIAVV
jgi:hypothetical protein